MVPTTAGVRQQSHGTLLWAALATVLLIAHCSLAQAQSPSPRGVILILADDVGADSFGVYGSERHTPNIDAMAENGFHASNFYMHPVCTPSRGSIVSARYPFRTGVVKNSESATIRSEDCLLARTMNQENITTFHAGKWQISPASKLHRIVSRCDFDYYFAWNQEDNRYYNGKFFTNIDGLTTDSLPSFSFEDEPGRLAAPSNTLVDTTGSFSPDVLTDLVLDFVRTREADERFFVYHAMLLPHNPVVNVPGFEHASTKQERFEGQVQYLDSIVGRINSALADMGMADDVLVVFTSDNGAKSDILTPWNGQLIRGDKFGFSDAGVRVPLVAQLDGAIAPGSSSPALSDCTDLLPTVYDAFGLSPPADIDGVSYWPTMLQPATAPAPRTWVFMQVNTRHSIRDHTAQVEEDDLYDVSQLFSRTPIGLTSDADVCSRANVADLYDSKARLVHDQNIRIKFPYDSSFQRCNGLVCQANELVCVESCNLDVYDCVECAPSDPSTCVRCSMGHQLKPSTGHCVPTSATTTPPTTTTTTTTTTATTTATTTTTTAACDVEHCASCRGNRSWRCAVCEDGYVMKRRGRECREPIECEVENCVQCKKNRPRRCKRCAAGYEPRMQRTRCDPPIPCQVEHCVECRENKPRRCQVCEQGYALYKNAKRCAEIGLCHVKNCEECHHGKPHRCKQCLPGHIKRKNNRRCIPEDN